MNYRSFLVLLSVIFAASLIIAQPNQGQNQNQNQNQAQNQANKPDIKRLAEYQSLGIAIITDNDPKPKNTQLIRKLKYIAKHENVMHEFILEDGTKRKLANTKPDKCLVINKETGLTVDEYNVELTCNIHYGDAAYRQAIDKLVSYYANKFKADIKGNKGVVNLQPSKGTESIEYKSPSKMTVTLFSDGITYTAVANTMPGKKVGATHTFIVRDPNKGPAGTRNIDIVLDFSPETQKIIEPLAREAFKDTGIWLGTRKGKVTNQSDILTQF